MRLGKTRPLIQYRFKDDMGFVTYKTFTTDREARLWYDRNRLDYGLKELQSVNTIYKSKNLNTSWTI